MKTTVEPKRPGNSSRAAGEGKWPGIFAGLFGGLLGLSLLKFGNPVIMEQLIERPRGTFEWLLNAWPVVIAYGLLGVVCVAGLGLIRRRANVPAAIAALPGIWLAWELIAGTQTVAPRATTATLVHFAACTACFYLGLFMLGGVRRIWPFWLALIAAFLVVLVSGLGQHFGGLEESRRYWFMYVYPTLKEAPPPAFLKKMESTRIFGTLFYPNTLAQIILLLLPMTLAVIWSIKRLLTPGARGLLLVLSGGPALACLYWSGSKGGWLLLLVVGIAGTLFLPFNRRYKIALVGAVLVLGLAGFVVKYRGFFQRGATSVVARFDYWQAACTTVERKPLFGNGPGTFGQAYQKLKRPESEMALLAHNDYLEQASDSGVPGFLGFTGLVLASMIYTFRWGGLRADWVRLAVWLGLLGWALQSAVEFGLYIPAVSWPAFAFMGWLLAGCSKRIDSRRASG